MAQPQPYVQNYSYQSELGSAFGTHLDSEFAEIANVIGQIEGNLALIQRDDGAVANQVVHANTFTSDALALMAGASNDTTVDWRPRGAWVTATLYYVGNIVETGSPATAYVCAVQHTSGVFATDDAAGYWVVLSAPRTLVSADVTTALGFTPVNKAGDTMTGALVMPTGSKILGASGITFSDTYLATQDLGRIDKGLYSVYTSSASDIVYGFASNVVRSAGAYFVVGGQFSGYGTSGAGSTIFGGNVNGIGLNGFTAGALVGLEVDVASYEPGNQQAKWGLDVVFLNRNTGSNPGQYSYTFPQGTYSNSGAGLGANYYNKNAKAVVISSQQRTATGEYCGWTRGLAFEEYALDSEYDAAYPANRSYPIGIDFSQIHYYGGSDPVAGYNMEAAIALRDLQPIWWNRDPSNPTSVNKIKSFFNIFTGRWVLMNGSTERFGVNVDTGTMYLNGVAFSGVSLAGNNTWTGTNTFNAAVSIGANLTFTGAARRIMGDLSNATVANRLLAQTTTPNSASEFGVIPSGTGGTSALFAHTDSAAASGQVARVAIDGAAMQISSTAVGAGAVVPMTFAVGASERARINTSGALLVGTTSAPVTNALLRVNGIIQCDNTVSFSAHKNAVAQSINDSTLTKVTFTTEEFDTNGSYDAANSRFTPPLGKYRLTAVVTYQGSAAACRISTSIYKNGAAYKSMAASMAATSKPTSAIVDIVVDANGTDYFEVYTYQDSGSARNVEGASTDSYFVGQRIG